MKTPLPLWKPAAVLGAVLLAFGAGLLYAREDASPLKVEATHLLTVPLEDVPGKEIDIRLYSFPPGSAVPWHIHPDAYEFEYEIEGTLMLEVEGEAPRELKTGDVFHLAPNVVHRGWNPSKTETAKIYVVRVKPVGAPLAEIVEPPKGQEASDTPLPAKPAGTYPEIRP